MELISDRSLPGASRAAALLTTVTGLALIASLPLLAACGGASADGAATPAAASPAQAPSAHASPNVIRRGPLSS